MATIKKRMLPAGWYPESKNAAADVLKKWSQSARRLSNRAIGCVVPHAGWEFSGELAFSALACLLRPIDTIVVIGGHLPPEPALLISIENRFETPFGWLESDEEVLSLLCADVDYAEDTHVDNTVEIQLPLIKHLFPEARILSMRVSPTASATALGKKLYKLSVDLDKTMAVVGSTDLTHYGPAYGFSPAGTGERAVNWVREENDTPFIDLLLKMDGEGAVDHANSHRSACSAGGAAAAVAFAAASGVKAGTLIGYRMSRDLHPADSFVGYGAIAFIP